MNRISAHFEVNIESIVKFCKFFSHFLISLKFYIVLYYFILYFMVGVSLIGITSDVSF